ncbi:hypothetical protein, partial [Succinimonas sp.]|uniref:hypothetical protein n=1 Tax=Succinimonas sp. TaxID=1936151 RepID=UPI0038637745
PLLLSGNTDVPFRLDQVNILLPYLTSFYACIIIRLPQPKFGCNYSTNALVKKYTGPGDGYNVKT